MKETCHHLSNHIIHIAIAIAAAAGQVILPSLVRSLSIQYTEHTAWAYCTIVTQTHQQASHVIIIVHIIVFCYRMLIIHFLSLMR